MTPGEKAAITVKADLCEKAWWRNFCSLPWACGMSLDSEFKASINWGSAGDLAVGVIIGAAFGKIVTSIVEDLAHAAH